MKHLSVNELKQFMELELNEPISIIDVREVYEYEAGHIPTAKNMPLSELPRMMRNLDKEQDHYVICQHGVRSVRACDYLKESGYRVINVDEGMAEWQGETE